MFVGRKHTTKPEDLKWVSGGCGTLTEIGFPSRLWSTPPRELRSTYGNGGSGPRQWGSEGENKIDYNVLVAYWVALRT